LPEIETLAFQLDTVREPKDQRGEQRPEPVLDEGEDDLPGGRSGEEVPAARIERQPRHGEEGDEGPETEDQEELVATEPATRAAGSRRVRLHRPRGPIDPGSNWHSVQLPLQHRLGDDISSNPRVASMTTGPVRARRRLGKGWYP